MGEAAFHIVRTGKVTGRRRKLFPLEPSQIDNSSPQEFAMTRNGFRLTLKKSDQLTKAITTLKGLIVLGPGRAFEVSAPVVSR